MPNIHAVLPNVWVMAGITAGLLLLLLYLIRVPTSYPLRGMVVAFSALAFAGSATLLGVQLWKRASHTVPIVQKGVRDLAEKDVEHQAVGPLDTYVPAMPGADSGIRRVQPAANGMPSGTIWDETTDRSVAEVVRYYADDANHGGWQVEFSASNGMVLRRTLTALGQLENERLRIQAMPNPDKQGRRTEIEFELTRRLK
jgi:hypothetical protein